LLAGRESESSQAWGSEPYFEGEISDVRVTWARKRCGELNCLLVLSMSEGRTSFRGWFARGSSQRDEPGIFGIFLGVYLGGIVKSSFIASLLGRLYVYYWLLTPRG
jgi:hypothetical protein